MGLATVPCLEILRSSVPGIQAALLTDMAPRPSEDENPLPLTAAHATHSSCFTEYITVHRLVPGSFGGLQVHLQQKTLWVDLNVLDVRAICTSMVQRAKYYYGVRQGKACKVVCDAIR